MKLSSFLDRLALVLDSSGKRETSSRLCEIRDSVLEREASEAAPQERYFFWDNVLSVTAPAWKVMARYRSEVDPKEPILKVYWSDVSSTSNFIMTWEDSDYRKFSAKAKRAKGRVVYVVPALSEQEAEGVPLAEIVRVGVLKDFDEHGFTMDEYPGEYAAYGASGQRHPSHYTALDFLREHSPEAGEMSTLVLIGPDPFAGFEPITSLSPSSIH